MVLWTELLIMILSALPFTVQAQPHDIRNLMDSEGQYVQFQKKYGAAAWRLAQAKLPKPVSTYPERNLQPGNILTVTKKIPLLPELYPSNPLESMNGIRTIYPGSTILVKQVIIKGHTPWYEVDVIFKGRGVIATGWINSIALQDQFEPTR